MSARQICFIQKILSKLHSKHQQLIASKTTKKDESLKFIRVIYILCFLKWPVLFCVKQLSVLFLNHFDVPSRFFYWRPVADLPVSPLNSALIPCRRGGVKKKLSSINDEVLNLSGKFILREDLIIVKIIPHLFFEGMRCFLPWRVRSTEDWLFFSYFFSFSTTKNSEEMHAHHNKRYSIWCVCIYVNDRWSTVQRRSGWALNTVARYPIKRLQVSGHSVAYTKCCRGRKLFSNVSAVPRYATEGK